MRKSILKKKSKELGNLYYWILTQSETIVIKFDAGKVHANRQKKQKRELRNVVGLHYLWIPYM